MPFTLREVVVAGADLGARHGGVGIEPLVGHRGDAAGVAHLHEIEAPRVTGREHPVLALEAGENFVDRALHAEGLAAGDAGERLFLLEHDRACLECREGQPGLEAHDFLGTRCAA